MWDAVGWLVARGLVQRPACADRRYDDGIRLDTGAACPTCTTIVGDRRALRARLAAEAAVAMPGAEPAARRIALEDRLRREMARAAEDLARRREQAAAELARRQAARLDLACAEEARARTEAERVAAAAEAARQQMPCADCGQEQAAGLCEAYGYRCETGP